MKRPYLLLTVAVLLLSACGKVSVPEEDKVLEVKNYNQVMRTGKVLIDPVHGEETAFFYGSLLGVGETNANGVGFIHTFKDGTSVVTAQLNILPLKKPEYFSASLVDDVTGKTIDMGELSSIIGDARHAAKLETKEDVSSSLHVVIFKHSKNGDAGVKVGEGLLKEPAPAK